MRINRVRRGRERFLEKGLRLRPGLTSMTVKFQKHLHELRAERFDFLPLTGVDDRAIVGECLVCRGNDHLVRKNDHADVAQDRSDVNQSAQTTQRARRRAHQRRYFAPEGN